LKAVVELAREDNLDCVRHERFGHALAIDGQTALVAAYYPYSTIDATARVYERTNDEWDLVAELTPSNEPFYRAYGVDVALKNGIAVIGASTQDDIGAAYVFEEDNGTWSQVAKLSSNGLTDLPNFGARVACDGERILVSASEASTLGDNSGVVFVYERIANTWQEVAQLDTGVYEGRTRFGRNVAIQGNWAFISAYKIDGAGAGHPGVVHVFERVNGNWLEVDRLLSPSMRRATYFGYEVVTDGDTTVIGSLEEVGAGYDGAAYVYRRVNGSWQNVARLVGPNGEAGTKFGANVALSGNTIAVGASIADTQYGVNSGVTHIFREIGGNWRLVESLEPANGTAQQAFGQPAVLDGNNLIV
ncbi:MAG: hypothetical protein KDA71_04610, partial [Planctomycetales bacterium]|nr:hypothetical protein [Planctomycetales bacterium]